MSGSVVGDKIKCEATEVKQTSSPEAIFLV